MLLNNKTARRQVAEINVVPYVDVMLVLLVIFMATAPAIMQGVQVNLPKMRAKTIESKQDNFPIVVSIDDKENIYLNISDSPTKPVNEKNLQIEIPPGVLTGKLFTFKECGEQGRSKNEKSGAIFAQI